MTHLWHGMRHAECSYSCLANWKPCKFKTYETHTVFGMWVTLYAIEEHILSDGIYNLYYRYMFFCFYPPASLAVPVDSDRVYMQVGVDSDRVHMQVSGIHILGNHFVTAVGNFRAQWNTRWNFYPAFHNSVVHPSFVPLRRCIPVRGQKLIITNIGALRCLIIYPLLAPLLQTYMSLYILLVTYPSRHLATECLFSKALILSFKKFLQGLCYGNSGIHIFCRQVFTHLQASSGPGRDIPSHLLCLFGGRSTCSFGTVLCISLN